MHKNISTMILLVVMMLLSVVRGATLVSNDCAYSGSLSATLSSVSILTLHIRTSGTSNDELFVAAPSSSASVVISANTYSSSSMDINSFVASTTHVKTTATHTINLPSTQSTSVCRPRVVVTVAAPPSVQTICFNNRCYCNCAVKGAGVNIHFTTAQTNVYDTLSYTGFGSVRMDYNWQGIEYPKGVYTYSEYDTLTNALTSRGITPYYILDYGNTLYQNGIAPTSTEAKKAFTNWAANSTLRYRGKNIIWEMWNEPNLDWFWSPAADVNAYISLAVATGQAIKSVTPGEIYIGAAISEVDRTFLQACFNGGLLTYWDAVSIHFYRPTFPETVANDVPNLRQMIRMNLPSDKLHIGILSGEWGYTTSTDPNDGRVVSETQQAQYLVREYLINMANDIPISIWYDFNDDGTDSTNSEHRFGVYKNTYKSGVTPAYDPKPAATAARVFYSKLGNLRFNKRIAVTNADTYVLLFTNADLASTFVIVVWTTGASTSVRIPSSSGTFTVTDLFGTTSTATVSGGFVTITATQSPQYLTPNAANSFLSVLSAVRRLPTETIGVGSVPIPISVRNPLSTSITVKIGSDAAITIPAGRTAVHTPTFFNDIQNLQATPISYLVVVTGLGNFTLSTNVIYDYPIYISCEQAIVNGCILDVYNPTGRAFTGPLTVVANTQTYSTTLSLAQGTTSWITVVPTGLSNRAVKFPFTVTLKNSANTVISSTARSYQTSEDLTLYADQTFPSQFTKYIDGTAGVSFSHTVKIYLNPPGINAPVPTFQMTYSFGVGWKYIMITPTTPKPINGVPTSAGSWIYGDGKGNWANIRIRDTTGQTFQYTYGQITWVGWQYRTVRLVDPGFWGGANDGVMHAPVSWDTYFVLDSNQAGSSGTVYFSVPTAIFE